MHDITIKYKPKAPIGYLKSHTTAGRNWLADNVKGLRVHNTAMAKPEELLAIIIKLTDDGKLTFNWIQ